MSKYSPIEMHEARALPATFRPWFSTPKVEELVNSVVLSGAFEEGFAAGRSAAEAEFEQDRRSLQNLIRASETLAPQPTDELSLMIASAVEQIVTQIVGEVEIDRALLIMRAQRAAEAIGEADAPRFLYLHPADAKLLEGVSLGLAIACDDRMPRGSLRIENANGSIEDGIATLLAGLREQIGLERQQ